MNAAERIAFKVGDADAGQRLDQVLAAHVEGLSRRRARVAIDLGGVFVDGRRTKLAGRPMKVGEAIVLHLGGALGHATNEVGMAARAADEARLPTFDIVHEDADIVVVDKPAGLLTAPTPESDRSNLLSLLERRGGRTGRTRDRLFVVHRIDLQTSGLLVFAKTEDANRFLSERFRTHDLDREYLVAVVGKFPGRLRRIDAPVGGRRARTHVDLEERFGERATLLRCRLETGRTHQIRLHMRGGGHPVIGDPAYGPEEPFEPRPPRMALHAARLGFVHPRTGQPVVFERPWPQDLQPWLVAVRTLASTDAPAAR